MNKFMLLVITALVITGNSIGQNNVSKVKIKWSPELKTSKKVSFSGVIGSEEDRIYVKQNYYERGGINRVQIISYDNSMMIKKSSEIEFQMGKEDLYLEYTAEIGDKIYFFVSSTDNKLDIKNLYACSLNKSTLRIEGDYKKLTSYSFGNKGRRNRGDFKFELSNNEEYLMVYIQKPYERNTKEEISLSVFDSALDLVWEKEEEVNFLSKNFSINSMDISNSGDVFILGKNEERIKGTKGIKLFNFIPIEKKEMIL